MCTIKWLSISVDYYTISRLKFVLEFELIWQMSTIGQHSPSGFNVRMTLDHLEMVEASIVTQTDNPNYVGCNIQL